MTPSRWLFFPTQASLTAAKVQFTGTLAKNLTGANRSGINNWAVSGTDAIEYNEYQFSGFRKLSTSIEWIVRLDTTQTYATLGDWLAANTPTLTGSTLSIGTSILPATGWSAAGASTGTLLRARFAASSTNLTSFWNSGSLGDTVIMNLNY